MKWSIEVSEVSIINMRLYVLNVYAIIELPREKKSSGPASVNELIPWLTSQDG